MVPRLKRKFGFMVGLAEAKILIHSRFDRSEIPQNARILYSDRRRFAAKLALPLKEASLGADRKASLFFFLGVVNDPASHSCTMHAATTTRRPWRGFYSRTTTLASTTAPA